MAVQPKTFSDVEACVDAIIAKVGKEIRLGLPLGLGKAIHLCNALYRRACADKSIKLHIATALSLEKPVARQDLERRFLEPFVERLYGGIPDLAYVLDLRRNKVPANITISEFFFKAGSYLHNADQQQNYICLNYTHAVRDLLALGINVATQIVAPDPGGSGRFSLSCNPDLSLDLGLALREREAAGTPVALVGEVNRHLPYMYNHAEVDPDFMDFVYDNPAEDYPLFSAPVMNIAPQDHMIGLYASTLLKDGGTLQVGIGSLGSAVVYNAILRHTDNTHYRSLVDDLKIHERFPVTAEEGGVDVFEKGLYGCSEMMVDGFMHLYRAGVLKREVYDDVLLQQLINEEKLGSSVDMAALDALLAADGISNPLRARDIQWLKQYGFFREGVELKGGRLTIDGQSIEPVLDEEEVRRQIQRYCLGKSLKGGVVMHGGFFIGPNDFYQALRDLPEAQARHFCMSSVNFINQLYDHRFGDQKLKRVQRQDSRFINSAMMHTLSGAAISDGLDDGSVVSGVGGQYNFVAMAHELPGARSIITLRATRSHKGEMQSNILFNYGHCTIPRHLRDIVVTEYGVADLRGKSDADVYMQLIQIADSRFQADLLKQAKRAGKLPANARIAEAYCHNTPERIREFVSRQQKNGLFQAFPFGTDFTEDELHLARALKMLKSRTATRRGLLATLWAAYRHKERPEGGEPLLARMGLSRPRGPREKLNQRLLIFALSHS